MTAVKGVFRYVENPQNYTNSYNTRAIGTQALNTGYYDKSNTNMSLMRPPIFVLSAGLGQGNVGNYGLSKFDTFNFNGGKSLLQVARSYIGYSEGDGSYLRFTNGRHEAWCADFVSYCARRCGLNFNFSSVQQFWDWGIKNNRFHKTPKIGDVVILKNNTSHTGFVENIGNGEITVIAGNTSDEVKRITYSLNDPRITGYVSLT